MKVKYTFHMEATLLFQIAQNYNRTLRFFKQAWTGPWGSTRFRIPKFLDSRHRKVVRLSGLRTGRLYPQEISLVLLAVTGCVDPRAIVRPEGLCQRKMKFLKGWIIAIISEHYIKLFGQYFNLYRSRGHHSHITNGNE